MSHSGIARFRDERGAIIINVATGLLLFTMLSAFVIDYGMQLVSRNQIQNAVDAAALASASAIAFDGTALATGDPSTGGVAAATARGVASANSVWGEATDPDATDVDFPACADSKDAGASAPDRFACVQVTAFRNDEHENPIPSLIARLMGIETLGVSATAIGEAKDATATDCLRPLAIPDRWQEQDAPPWSETSTFDKSNPNPLLWDIYARPDPITTGYGLTLSDPCLAEGVVPSCGYGAKVTLHAGALANPIPAWSYLPVDIPGSASSVLQNMQACAAVPVVLRPKVGPARRLTVESGAVASVADGANYLVNVADPGAVWNPVTKRVEGSCAQSATPCAPISPRIIAIALYNPNTLYNEIAAGGATSVVVTNAIGFFIDTVVGTDLKGYITTYPGQVSPEGVTLIEDSSFLRTTMLVQ